VTVNLRSGTAIESKTPPPVVLDSSEEIIEVDFFTTIEGWLFSTEAVF
jgi:hypothetical protein